MDIRKYADLQQTNYIMKWLCNMPNKAIYMAVAGLSWSCIWRGNRRSTSKSTIVYLAEDNLQYGQLLDKSIYFPSPWESHSFCRPLHSEEFSVCPVNSFGRNVFFSNMNLGCWYSGWAQINLVQWGFDAGSFKKLCVVIAGKLPLPSSFIYINYLGSQSMARLHASHVQI